MSFLIQSSPLIVLTELAKAIGLNEAIVLQQVHYWVQKSPTGWVYNTYEDWQQDNFSFWSVATVRRTVNNLEKTGFLISKQDQGSFNRKKYYSIDYKEVDKIGTPVCSDCADDCSNRAHEFSQDEHLLTETTTDISIPSEYCAAEIETPKLTKTSKKNETEHYLFYLALCELTKNNPDLQLRKVHGMVKKLTKAGYTIADVNGFNMYWQKDFRFIKDRRSPSVEEVFTDLEKSKALYVTKEEKDVDTLLSDMFGGDVPEFMKGGKNE